MTATPPISVGRSAAPLRAAGLVALALVRGAGAGVRLRGGRRGRPDDRGRGAGDALLAAPQDAAGAPDVLEARRTPTAGWSKRARAATGT